MSWVPLRGGAYGVAANRTGTDPMWIWGEATGYRDFGPEGLDPTAGLRFVIERTTNLAPTFTSERLTPQQWRAARRQIRRIELAEPVVPERLAVRKTKGLSVAKRSPPKSTAPVLVGIIDSGCPFASKMVRNPAGKGTRVLSIWDQDDHPAFMTTVGSFRPKRQGYGCAIDQAALNVVMGNATFSGSLDEEQCYRDTRYDAVRDRFSHGAAVISQLFAPSLYGGALQRGPGLPPSWDQVAVPRGRDSEPAGLPVDEADLVFVQMPRAGIQDSTSAALSRYLIDGLRYIIDHASGEKAQRIVVNISSGTSRTTHDGLSLLESALVAMASSTVDPINANPIDLTIVVPTGNTNEEQRHAVLSDSRYHLEFFLPPGCEMPQYVTVRWPKASAGVHLRVTPPNEESGRIRQGQAMGWPSARRPECGVISVKPGASGVAQSLIAFAPTASPDPNRVLARPGRWKFELEFDGVKGRLAEPVMFWVSRNQRNPGALTRGRQADFIDWDERHNPERYLRRTEDDPNPSPRNGIRRRGALSGMATVAAAGDKVLVVGGFVLAQKGSPPSRYSAAGPAAGKAKGRRLLPDVSAPNDTSWALPGLSVHANLSGDVVRVIGTSFAAPLVARAVVNGFAPRRQRTMPTATDDEFRSSERRGTLQTP